MVEDWFVSENNKSSQPTTLTPPKVETLEVPVKIETEAKEKGETIVEERSVEEFEKKIEETSEFIPIERVLKILPMRILVTGKPKVGKSHFSLTAEAPILLIDTEFSFPALAPKFAHKKILWAKLIDVNEKTNELDSVLMLEKLDRWLTKIEKMVREGKIKTVVFDSVTSLWKYCQDWLRYEVVRVGGKLNMKGVPADRRDWWRANSKYEGILNRLNALGVNVIYTAQAMPEYDERGNLTGKYKPSYQKSTPFLVDMEINLYTRFDNAGKLHYYGVIESCRYPVEGIVGMEIENPTFDKIKKLIMEGIAKYVKG